MNLIYPSIRIGINHTKMYKKIIYAALFVLCSCNTNNRITFYSERTDDTQCVISIKVMKGGTKEQFVELEENALCYSYPDSSFFYISTFKYSDNYHNIKMLGDSIFNFRFQNRELCKEINASLGEEYYQILPDIFELSGINADSLCWRDIIIDNVSIGYSNVHPKRQEQYNKCLDTYKVKKRKK